MFPRLACQNIQSLYFISGLSAAIYYLLHNTVFHLFPIFKRMFPLEDIIAYCQCLTIFSECLPIPYMPAHLLAHLPTSSTCDLLPEDFL